MIFCRAKETHQIAEAAQEKNARLREAFGLGEYYVDGSAFDPDRKAKEEAAKALAMAQKKYRLVRLLFVQATQATCLPVSGKAVSMHLFTCSFINSATFNLRVHHRSQLNYSVTTSCSMAFSYILMHLSL